MLISLSCGEREILTAVLVRLGKSEGARFLVEPGNVRASVVAGVMLLGKEERVLNANIN